MAVNGVDDFSDIDHWLRISTSSPAYSAAALPTPVAALLSPCAASMPLTTTPTLFQTPKCPLTTPTCTSHAGEPHRDAEHVRVAVHPHEEHEHHDQRLSQPANDSIHGTTIQSTPRVRVAARSVAETQAWRSKMLTFRANRGASRGTAIVFRSHTYLTSLRRCVQALRKAQSRFSSQCRQAQQSA